MGFFDDVVGREKPERLPSGFADLAPMDESSRSDDVPADRILPAAVPAGYEAGAGRYVRLILRGFSVWPDRLTIHLSVFARRRHATNQPRRYLYERHGGSLRVGLLLGDGRRVTTLDGEPYPPGSVARPCTLRWRRRGMLDESFHTAAELLLTGLPKARRSCTWSGPRRRSRRPVPN